MTKLYRRSIVALFAVILCLGIGVAILYFTYKGERIVIAIEESQLQERINKKVPVSKEYKPLLFTITVTLQSVTVDLAPSGKPENIKAASEAGTAPEKVRITGHLELHAYLKGHSKPLGATITALSGVTYDGSTKAFYLDEPVVEEFVAQGFPIKFIPTVSKYCQQILGDYLKRHPVYELPENDLKQSLAKALLQDVEIKNDMLFLTLEY